MLLKIFNLILKLQHNYVVLLAKFHAVYLLPKNGNFLFRRIYLCNPDVSDFKPVDMVIRLVKKRTDAASW